MVINLTNSDQDILGEDNSLKKISRTIDNVQANQTRTKDKRDKYKKRGSAGNFK
jgi:hypothetical protein